MNTPIRLNRRKLFVFKSKLSAGRMAGDETTLITVSGPMGMTATVTKR